MNRPNRPNNNIPNTNVLETKGTSRAIKGVYRVLPGTKANLRLTFDDAGNFKNFVNHEAYVKTILIERVMSSGKDISKPALMSVLQVIKDKNMELSTEQKAFLISQAAKHYVDVGFLNKKEPLSIIQEVSLEEQESKIQKRPDYSSEEEKKEQEQEQELSESDESEYGYNYDQYGQRVSIYNNEYNDQDYDNLNEECLYPSFNPKSIEIPSLSTYNDMKEDIADFKDRIEDNFLTLSIEDKKLDKLQKITAFCTKDIYDKSNKIVKNDYQIIPGKNKTFLLPEEPQIPSETEEKLLEDKKKTLEKKEITETLLRHEQKQLREITELLQGKVKRFTTGKLVLLKNEHIKPSYDKVKEGVTQIFYVGRLTLYGCPTGNGFYIATTATGQERFRVPCENGKISEKVAKQLANNNPYITKLGDSKLKFQLGNEVVILDMVVQNDSILDIFKFKGKIIQPYGEGLIAEGLVCYPNQTIFNGRIECDKNFDNIEIKKGELYTPSFGEHYLNGRFSEGGFKGEMNGVEIGRKTDHVRTTVSTNGQSLECSNADFVRYLQTTLPKRHLRTAPSKLNPNSAEYYSGGLITEDNKTSKMPEKSQKPQNLITKSEGIKK
jgi:hypothetical protein